MTSFRLAPVSKLSIVTNGRWLNEDNLLLLPERQALIGNIRIYSIYFLICVFAPLSVNHLLFIHLSVCLLICLSSFLIMERRLECDQLHCLGE